MKELERGTGILLPIASLPSAHGIGTLGDEAYRFVDLLADLHMRYWQVLPIGPTGYLDSPYLTFSVFAGNPYYVDLDELEEQGLLTGEEIKDFSKESDRIDYGFLYENRLKLLRMAFDRFDSRNSEFTRFVSENKDWVYDYSLFMTAREVYGCTGWWTWPTEIRDRKGAEFHRFCVEQEITIKFYEFIQFMFVSQWMQLKQYASLKGVLIIGELPLYTAVDSVDVWVNREFYDIEDDGSMTFSAGCPPDRLYPDGQRWGSPTYNYVVMEKDGFTWWRKRITWATTLFDVVRVNHFRGILNYYCVPKTGKDGRDGHWVKGPGRKLTDVIQKNAGDTPIFAEDFGTALLPQVVKLLDRYEWSGMKVLLYAFDSDSSNSYLPHNFSSDRTVTYLTIPDSRTVVGYFKDRSEDSLDYLYSYLNISSKAEIPNALIRLAYSSNSRVVMFQLQDILGLDDEACLNTGRLSGDNWKWRFKKEAISEEKRRLIRRLSVLYRR